ncbi:MAG TPA: outer membrane lipoprotein carrier protein LolA [Phycisphaerales bacterium]|nr:outer membrane lipoprotein carrier protein LolA [Phycisphaerales bacterium]
MPAAVLAVALGAHALAQAPSQPQPTTTTRPTQGTNPVQPGTAPVSSFDKKLEELDATVTKIEDLTADFEQEKRTPLLKKPLVSSGTVKVKGSTTRWDTLKPRPTAMTIDASELKIYYPEQKTVEVYPVAGGMAELAASPLPRNKTVREHFTIAEVPAKDIDANAKDGELGLALTPIKDTLKEHVAQVRVIIDGTTGIGRLVEITDADGEVTVMRFSNVKTNTGLKDEDVTLKTPERTTISRPLQGEAPKPADPSTQPPQEREKEPKK